MPCLQCIDGWNIEQQIDTSRLWPFQSILGPTELLIVDGFISFRGKRRRRPFFSFSTYKKNLACRTLPVEMVWARNWVGEFFFHETQVRWRPSEALRPVHDVVWKLNRLATKTEKHFWSILLVLVIDMEHLIYMYIYIYMYTEVAFVDKIYLGNIFCCYSLPIVFWHTIWRGDAFSLSQGLTLNTLLNSCGS